MAARYCRSTPLWTSQQRRPISYMKESALLVCRSLRYIKNAVVDHLSKGQSVYWQSMFQKSVDPTFVLLTFIWHAIYAWDEALENLYQHICSLVSFVVCHGLPSQLTLAQETRVISTAEMPLTRELHIIRAHHLHYQSLLDDFSKHIHFIRDTHNPALEHLSEADRSFNKRIMDRECANLLSESKRLTAELHMQERRLKNVMGLVSPCLLHTVVAGLIVSSRCSAVSILLTVGTCGR